MSSSERFCSLPSLKPNVCVCQKILEAPLKSSQKEGRKKFFKNSLAGRGGLQMSVGGTCFILMWAVIFSLVSSLAPPGCVPDNLYIVLYNTSLSFRRKSKFLQSAWASEELGLLFFFLRRMLSFGSQVVSYFPAILFKSPDWQKI